jgi:hypothetical protein
MKFPYGNADFYDVITSGYFYVDRTGFISVIVAVGFERLVWEEVEA